MMITEWFEKAKALCKKYPVYTGLVLLVVVSAAYFLVVTQSMRPALRGLRTMKQSNPSESLLASNHTIPPSQAIKGTKALRWLGMDLLPINRALRKEFGIPREVQGFFVYGLNKQYGLAAMQSVQMFDVIRGINHTPVPKTKDFINVTNQIPYQHGILLDIYRNGRGIYVSVPFSFDYGPLNSTNMAQQQF